jgi:hypothetical protein
MSWIYNTDSPRMAEGRTPPASNMVRIEGHDLEVLKAALSGDRPVYLLRVMWCGDSVKVKANAGEWTHSIGTEQQPY